MSRRETIEKIVKSAEADALPEAIADADPNTRRYVEHLASREGLAPEALWEKLRAERAAALAATEATKAAEQIAMEVRGRH